MKQCLGKSLNDLSVHLKKVEKEDQIKTKVSRRKEIVNKRTEIDEIENR